MSITVNTSMSDIEYKAYIENRVTGHEGTTFLEVTIIPLAIVLANAVSTSFAGTSRILEWLFLVPPTILLFASSSTTTSYHIATVIFVICGLYLGLKYTPWTSSKNNEKKQISTSSSSNNKSSFYDPATAMLRSTLMLQTIVAILQVDFPIFPFRFMKCESFGISLMDIGVGGFVFSGAISRVAGDIMKDQLPNKDEKDSNKKPVSALKSFLKLLGTSIPLFVAGVARFTFVAVTGYQEHVTEYGTHWNFFLTLGSMPLVVFFAHFVGGKVMSLVNGLNSKNKNDGKNKNSSSSIQNDFIFDAVLGAMLLFIHQFALTKLGLTEYVMSPHRRTFIEGNKEGLVSSVGYSALYLMARGMFGLTQYYLTTTKTSSKNSDKTSSSSFVKIFILLTVGLSISAVAYFIEVNIQQFSRRLCNSPYVLFCLGGGFLSYAFCKLVVDIISLKKISGDDDNKRMLTSLGDNQLGMFLFANICTGSTNKLMRTVFASTQTSYVVMVVYVTTVLVVGTILAEKQIKLKFW